MGNVKEIIKKISLFTSKVNEKWNVIQSKYFLCKLFPKNIIVLILFIISLLIGVDYYFNNNEEVIYRENHIYNQALDVIYDKPVKFKLYNHNIKKNFDTISLRFATLGRVNNSKYNFTLLKDSQKVYSKDFNTKKIGDGEYYDFILKNDIDYNNVEEYTMVLTPIYTDGNNCITLFCDSDKNAAVAYKKQLNIEPQIIILVSFIGIYLFIQYMVNSNNLTPHTLFALSAVYILITLFITPPLQVPDEGAHYKRAIQLTQYDISLTPYDNFHKPIRFNDNLYEVNYSATQSRDFVNSFDDIVDSLDGSEQSHLEGINGITTIGLSLAYVVPALIIKIVLLFTNSPLLVFYSGRIVCAALNIFIIHKSIKMAPKFKKSMLLIALMPMNIQSMISYSYDGILNAMILLFISLVLNMMYDKNNSNITKKYVISVLILAVIALIKLPYALLGVMLLFIDNEKFKGIINKYAIICATGILALGVYWANGYISNIGAISLTDGAKVVNNESNMSYIINNPTYIFKLMYHTLQSNIRFYIESIVGYFGYFVIKLNNLFKYIYLFLIGLLLVTEENNLKKGWRILLLSILSIITIGIFLALYFSWSGYKAYVIDGVQGRYFIPLILPLIVVFSRKFKNIEFSINSAFSIAMIIVMNYLMVIFSYYY